MVIVTGMESRPPARPEPGPIGSNPLFSIVIAAVVLCSIFTTVFTAGRLVTKRFVSKFEADDCECQFFHKESQGPYIDGFGRFVACRMGEHTLHYGFRLLKEGYS